MGRLFCKFLLASWLALLVAGMGVGTAVWWRHQMLEQDLRNAEALAVNRRAGFFVAAAAEVLQYGGNEALRQFLHQARDRPFPLLYAVDDTGRDILDRELAAQVLDQARHWHARHGDTDAVRKVVSVDGGDYLLFASSPELRRDRFEAADTPPLMRDDGSQHGPADTAENHGPPPRWRSERPPKPPSLWVLVVSGTLASLLMSAVLAWYFAKPIRNLRRAFAAAADGKLEVRIAATMGARHDELADLGRDFDHMAARLESLILAQQRLLHDVSHEVRSPLARMQAAIGLAQQQPEKIPDILQRVERESQRISDLVGELLVLSRLEAGVSDGEAADTDLSGLLADIVEDARFEAERKQVVISYRGFENASVKTHGELLHRAVENVLRNAVEHCRTGGEIDMRARFDVMSQTLALTITDQGPGVAEADLQVIFQPFFRSGGSPRPNSVGLGLTIAQRAIKNLGGAISASNRPEGGLRVEIGVPFS